MKKLKFKILLVLISVLPAILIATTIAIFSITELTSIMESDVFSKLLAAATGLKGYYEYDLNHDGIEYEEDYVDSLKSQDIELTVFEGDTRFMTSLLNAEGKRNIGTQADAQIFADVKSGKTIEKSGVTIGGSQYYVAYIPMYKGNEFWGMAFAGAPDKDVKASIAKVRNIVILLTVVLAFIIFLVMFFIATKLTKTILKTVDALEVLAGGEVHKDLSFNSNIAEIDIIGHAISKLQAQLSESVDSINVNVESLVMAIGEVDGLAERNSDSAIQINTAIGELANAAQSMASSVQDTAEQTSNMGMSIEDITTSIEDLTQAANKIKDANHNAIDAMQSVLNSSNESVEAINGITKKISETNDAIEKINDAVAIITGISSQTKLLSLNASIEAARAGEHGRGFAVVASEIQQLAAQSEEGALTIQSIAKEISQLSNQSVKAAEDVKAIITDEQNLVTGTQEKFDTLAEAVESANTEIAAISDKTYVLDTVKNQINSNVSDLSAVSEENGASAEEVSASCETMATGITDTRAKTEEMSALAEQLKSAIAYFK